MKKIKLVLASMLAVVSFASCGNKTLTPKIAQNVNPESAAAKTLVNGKTNYFATASEAWDYVNASTSTDSEMTLLKDWIAEDGVFGNGSGYGSTGNLTPIDRDSKDIAFTLDLNGYTLDRNLDAKKSSGNIISLKKDGIFTIKNGTLTGGFTSDRGGALWLDNNETTVYLDNLILKGNYAKGNGGAIFIKQSDIKVNFNNVTITDNKSENYGGAIYIQGDRTFRKSEYNFSGICVIKENEGKDNRNNLTLQNGWKMAHLTDVSGLLEGSKIYLAFSDFAESLIAEQKGSNSIEGFENYFKSDNYELKIAYTIVEGKGTIRTIKY